MIPLSSSFTVTRIVIDNSVIKLSDVESVRKPIQFGQPERSKLPVSSGFGEADPVLDGDDSTPEIGKAKERRAETKILVNRVPNDITHFWTFLTHSHCHDFFQY